MDVVIIASIALMGIAANTPSHSHIWLVFETVFATIFVIEMLARLALERCLYFSRLLNIIDFVVACTSLVDVIIIHAVVVDGMGLSLVKLLRLVRLVRVLKLLRVFSSLRAMGSSILHTIKPMMTLFPLMGVVVYVFAIPCVIMMGSRDAGYPGFTDNVTELDTQELEYFNNYRYFGTMGRAMITLFHLSMQSDELTEIIRATSAVQYWPPFFFIFFVLLMTLCLFNTIIGVIVDKTVSTILLDESHKKFMRQKQVSAIEDLASIMFELDANQDQKVSLSELQAGADNPSLTELLREIQLPFGFTVDELFLMLDEDGDGFISRNEFIGGLFRTVFSNEFQRECMLRLGQAHVKHTISAMKADMIDELKLQHQELLRQMQASFAQSSFASDVDQAVPDIQIRGAANKFTMCDKDLAGMIVMHSCDSDPLRSRATVRDKPPKSRAPQRGGPSSNPVLSLSASKSDDPVFLPEDKESICFRLCASQGQTVKEAKLSTASEALKPPEQALPGRREQLSSP